MKEKISGIEEASGVSQQRKPRGHGVVRTVGAFTIGAAVGSIVALLFAPASGRATRRRIAMKFHTYRQATLRKLGQAKRLLGNKAESLRDAAGEKINHAREWVADRLVSGNSRRAARQRAARHA